MGKAKREPLGVTSPLDELVRRETPRPQECAWTLTAPDGRTWIAESPMRACSKEQRERVPPDVALARIFSMLDETEKGDPMKGYYKVPFRQVYCETFRDWLSELIYCHVCLRLSPPKLPEIA